MFPLSRDRILGIIGAVAITLVLQSHGYRYYVWFPAALIAYGITPIPLGLVFRRRRSESAVDTGLPSPLSSLSNETIRENIIGMALMLPDGQHQLDFARHYIARMVARGRFNTERAIEVMTMAVDNAVWADVSRQKKRAGRLPRVQSKRVGTDGGQGISRSSD
jgi:hypothetical protein